MTAPRTIATTIRDACTTITREWDHMLPAPTSTSIRPHTGHGAHTSNPRGADNSDNNDDITTLDAIISTRADITITLNGWARVILEDLNPNTPPPHGNDITGLCDYITTNALTFSGHEAAEDAADELTTCANHVTRITQPRRRTTITLGSCPLGGCQGTIRAHPTWRDETTGDAWATCDTCEQQAVATWWRDRMGLTNREQLTTPEVVTLARQEFGVALTHRAVQGLVRRKQLVPITGTTPQQFHLADCIAYLTRRAG